MNVLVAGGAGYIGSHTVKRLKESGHNPVIYDNLSRGHKIVVEILKVPSVFADLNNRETLLKALRDHRIDTVMHFAAYAYVGESVEGLYRQVECRHRSSAVRPQVVVQSSEYPQDVEYL